MYIFLLVIIVILVLIYLFYNNKQEKFGVSIVNNTTSNPIGFIIYNYNAGNGIQQSTISTLTNNFSNNTYKTNNVFQFGGNNSVGLQSGNINLTLVEPYGLGQNVSSNDCFITSNTNTNTSRLSCNVYIPTNPIDWVSQINSLPIGGTLNNVPIGLYGTSAHGSGWAYNSKGTITVTRVI